MQHALTCLGVDQPCGVVLMASGVLGNNQSRGCAAKLKDGYIVRGGDRVHVAGVVSIHSSGGVTTPSKSRKESGGH